jgi:hypothetical protein
MRCGVCLVIESLSIGPKLGGVFMRVIELPRYDIRVTLPDDDSDGGHVDLTSSMGDPNRPVYDAVVAGIEALILTCAICGVDIESPKFVRAIEAAVGATGRIAP